MSDSRMIFSFRIQCLAGVDHLKSMWRLWWLFDKIHPMEFRIFNVKNKMWTIFYFWRNQTEFSIARSMRCKFAAFERKTTKTSKRKLLKASGKNEKKNRREGKSQQTLIDIRQRCISAQHCAQWKISQKLCTIEPQTLFCPFRDSLRLRLIMKMSDSLVMPVNNSLAFFATERQTERQRRRATAHDFLIK